MDINKILSTKNGKLSELYHQKVISLIRQRYTVNEELSILRKLSVGEINVQNERVVNYNNYVNECKSIAHQEVYDN